MLRLIDVNSEIKKLYQDAMYFHLIHQGYTDRKAKSIVKKAFSNY